MADHDDNNEIIEVDFEVRHVSILRSEPTNHNPPRTHDWKVFLRSAEINGDLSRLIQRCIFHLHPEYPNFKRELKTSPYAIQETGYAGFKLPIEIYFKTKKEPRKFRIEYDLDLHRNIDGHPSRQKESYLRKYRCSFYNPDPEFREKILAAGGKIVESGPVQSTSIDPDESSLDNELITRQSPQQKRPASPVSTSNGIGNKKLKIEPTTATTTIIKKKPVQSVTNKTIVNTKKTKLLPHKSSSSLLDEKISKSTSNQTNTSVENTENSSTNKSRPMATKLIKSQSTTNINPSSQSVTIKKKEPLLSPTKTKTLTNSQTIPKKTINKTSLKPSVKQEITSTAVVKSPINIKQEPSSQPTVNAISNLKKIPKKPVVPKTEEKRSQSLKPKPSSSTSNRNSLPINEKSSQKSTKEPTKSKTSLKREHSLSSINTTNSSSDRPKKIKTTSISSRNESNKPIIPPPPPPLPSSSSSSPPKSTRTSPQSQLDSAINSTVSSPSTQPSSIETNHIETPFDTYGENYDEQLRLSEKSDSPAEQIAIEPMKISSTRLSCSDQSETSENDLYSDNDLTNEQDLPITLTNDDLRYKLIFIYKRFQLNSINDLIIFVQFFKRHQLIDVDYLSTMKSTNEMITYDLFLLNPSQIIELANDLGYTTMNIVNSIE